jgi:hypothetical protein
LYSALYQVFASLIRKGKKNKRHKVCKGKNKTVVTCSVVIAYVENGVIYQEKKIGELKVLARL